MALQQVYYTSCDSGLRGGSGFQINAASARLDSSTLALIERYSGYQPPMLLAYDRQAAVEDFPQALSYYQLAEQTWVVARSVYLGATGAEQRGGNFFTHSLVSLEGAAGFEGRLPIQYWDGRHWQTTAQPTTQLPDIPAPPATPEMNPHATLSFLQGQPEHLQCIGWLLAATLEALRTGRRVVIVAPDRNCASWIAAVSFALPRSIAYRLSFSTYTRDPAQRGFHITGLDPREERSWSKQQVLFEWYVLDERGGILSPLETTTSFVSFAAGAYRRGRLSDLEQFVDWCDGLSTPPRPETLDQLCELFQMGGGYLERPAVLAAAGTLAAHLGEPLSVIRPALGRLAGLDPRRPETQEAILRVCAGAGAAPRLSRAEVWHWFSAWLSEQLLPIAQLADVERVSEHLPADPLPPAETVRLAEVLDWRLQVETDVALSRALLRLSLRLNLADQLSDGRLAALRRLVAQEMPDPATEDLLIAMIRQRDNKAFLIMFNQLEYLAAVKPYQLSRWRRLVTQRDIREQMLLYCRADTTYLPLYFFLRMQDVDGSKQASERLIALLQSIERDFPGVNWKAGNLDSFEEICLQPLFPADGVGPAEARILLNKVEPVLIGITVLWGKIANGLLREPALDRDEFFLAIEKLSALRRTGATTREGLILDSLSHWRSFIRNPLQREELSQTLAQVLQKIPPSLQELRVQLIEMTLRSLLQERPDGRTLRALLLSPELGQAEIAMHFERLLVEQRKRRTSVEWFCVVFETLAGTRLEQGKYATTAFANPLRMIWSTFNRRQQNEVDVRLSAGRAAAVWQVWRGDPSLLERMRRRLAQ